MQEIIEIINKASEKANGMITLMNQKEAEIIGQKAMDFIADYPLYAATSNISYPEAITIAIICGGEEIMQKAYDKVASKC